MKKIINHLKENWIRYGFEAIVVTASIIGAFTLNTWKEERINEATEIKLLNEIAMELQKDLSLFDTNINMHNGGKRASEIILESITSDQSYRDSLALYFAMTHNYTVFSPNTGAYESLKSLGIELIKNDTLRLDIIHLYEQGYNNLQVNIKLFTDHMMDVKLNIDPPLFEEFNFFDESNFGKVEGSYGGKMIPVNYEALKTNQIYLYHLKSLKKGHEFMIVYNKLTKNWTMEVKERVQMEIELREKK